MGDGVEWAIHCCMLLGTLRDGQTLPAARLAEFHGVPPAYLAKHLQALTTAGIAEALPGRHGGYRLARPAHEITLLAVVTAVDGDEPAFRCGEIRQRGPAAGPPSAYMRPCGIARAMWRAEEAWRAELASRSVGQLIGELRETVPRELLHKAAAWVGQVDITRRKH